MFAVTILPRLDTFFHPQCAQSLYSHRLPNGHEIARAHIPHPDHLHKELNSKIRVKENYDGGWGRNLKRWIKKSIYLFLLTRLFVWLNIDLPACTSILNIYIICWYVIIGPTFRVQTFLNINIGFQIYWRLPFPFLCDWKVLVPLIGTYDLMDSC